MKKGKGRSRFYSLPEKTAINVQIESLKQDFEMAKNSIVAKDVINHYNTLAAKYEETKGIKRVSPGNMCIKYKGEEFILPLINWDEVESLANSHSYSNYKEVLQLKQYQVLTENVKDSTLHDLWSLVDPPRLINGSSHSSVLDLLPKAKKKDKPGIVTPDKAGAQIKQRKIDETDAPEEIKEEMIDFMAGYGIRLSLATSMISSLASQREYLYPRIEELKSGQVIWLARSTEYKPRWGNSTADYLQPIVITLYSPDELGNPSTSRERQKIQELERIARITSEAWLQNAVFTMVDLEMLINRSAPYIKNLIDLYREHYQMWLPTAGTILDIGRCISHKKDAVELSLQGLNTKKIAWMLFHTTGAIDRYLNHFHKVSLLHIKLNASKHEISYLLDCSQSLVEEYLDLAHKYRDQLPFNFKNENKPFEKSAISK